MKVQRNISLKKYTTFQIGGPANYFLAASSKEELVEAIEFAKSRGSSPLILGGGSNLLISDKGYGGIVVKVENCWLEIKGGEITAGAGVKLSALVKKAVENSLSGFEWASGIPGTLGGAVRGNAGAFEGEMADNVEKVEIYDIKRGKTEFLSNKECQFGYRTSVFKKNPNLVVLSAKLALEEGDKEKIKEKVENYLNYRREKHPKEPSAGSVFKNVRVSPPEFQSLIKKFPELKQFQGREDIPAAFLIDRCGLKGKEVGSAQISELHPNFIINLNGAEAKDVLKLIELTKAKIKEKFGIELEEEIQYLGF